MTTDPKSATADAIVAEWKDWIPYPDSPLAEWDRYALCVALADRKAELEEGKRLVAQAAVEIEESDKLLAEAESRLASPCPNIVHGEEGTSYCRLNGPPEREGAQEIAAKRDAYFEGYSDALKDKAPAPSAASGLEHIPEYFAKQGITETIAEAHPMLLVRQMANEILRLRSHQAPVGEGRDDRAIDQMMILRGMALSALERQGSGSNEPPLEKGGLEKMLQHAINSVCAENQSNTPDFILSNFLMNALAAVDTAIQQRDRWYGIRPAPGSHQAQDAQTGEGPTVAASEAILCCQDYEKCSRPCTPRGAWLQEHGRYGMMQPNPTINEPPQVEPRQQEHGVLNSVAGTGPASGSPDGQSGMKMMMDKSPPRISVLVERLEGAYSTVFERSLAREAAKAIRVLEAERDFIEGQRDGARQYQDALQHQLTRTREMLKQCDDVLSEISVPSFEDSRISYVEVQMDKETYSKVDGLLAEIRKEQGL